MMYLSQQARCHKYIQTQRKENKNAVNQQLKYGTPCAIENPSM